MADNQNIVESNFEVHKTALVSRGIDEPTWNALCETVYPGAKPHSVMMVVDYCKARKLDPLMKPVHIVPMQVENKNTGNKEWRDVVMPGIGSYRIQADRSNNYAGADDPEYGPTIKMEGKDSYGNDYSIQYPEWCSFTVYKMVDGQRVAFKAKERWLENYAVQKSGNVAPNAMWKRRPFAQLAKCAEAQALRRAWPEVGNEPTIEEMDGKGFGIDETTVVSTQTAEVVPDTYPQDEFDGKKAAWIQNIAEGKKTADAVINFINSRSPHKLSADQEAELRAAEPTQQEASNDNAEA